MLNDWTIITKGAVGWTLVDLQKMMKCLPMRFDMVEIAYTASDGVRYTNTCIDVDSMRVLLDFVADNHGADIDFIHCAIGESVHIYYYPRKTKIAIYNSCYPTYEQITDLGIPLRQYKMTYTH
jgi:hypothetical protein